MPSNPTTLPNAIAVDRALQLCSLTEGDQPFHLVLDISQPARAAASLQAYGAGSQATRNQDMRAQVEVFWLSPITYRTVIRSRSFNQTRIVNGRVTEEHNTGEFYPRWIQNFVDAILNPVPQAARLKKIPGAVPIGIESHACISDPAPADSPEGGLTDETGMAQICFQDAEPRIASGVDFTRSVWFDDFEPFGAQQIARTLVNDLPANVLLRGRITLLEPLRQSYYPLLKATEFTLPEKQIQTTLVPASTAESLLELAPARFSNEASPTYSDPQSGPLPVSFPARLPASQQMQQLSPSGDTADRRMVVYIRTDRTGRVREAYRDKSDQFGLQNAAVARALTLKFKPLVINGVPRQMETALVLSQHLP